MDGNQSLDLQLGEVLGIRPNQELGLGLESKIQLLKYYFGQICFKQFILQPTTSQVPIYITLKDKLGLTIFVCQVNLQTLAYCTQAYAIIFARLHVS